MIKAIKIFFVIIQLVLVSNLVSCVAEDVTEPVIPSCSAVSGQINVNSGSSSGGSCFQLFNKVVNSQASYLCFNNINLTFFPASGIQIVDVGAQCLSDVNSWPGGITSAIAVILEHSYIIQYIDNTYIRFVVNSYSDGVVRLTYVNGL